jgi:hypothetical protein
MPKDNDSTIYLWHCRLGHIGVKCMKKLHANGFLKSLDYESFETCEPCLMGKMTKTPFFRTKEQATDLLEIIYTDTTRKRHTSGAPVLATNGALQVRH